MTTPERLAELYAKFAEQGMPCLVMGGHAVRYYGVDRRTVDFDFHLALDDAAWVELSMTLRKMSIARELREGPTWRPRDFRRFIVGRLPDGRDELLECWRRNHLLPPFPELFARREEGTYGGATVAFLSLSDLIQSKETEREDDWRDVSLLEEIADERRLSAGTAHGEVLAHLRSRRGFEAVERSGWFADRRLLMEVRPANPIAAAYLAPYRSVPPFDGVPGAPVVLIELLAAPLRHVAPASPRHLALVEVTRRLYKKMRIDADRADKERAASGA